MHVSHCSDSVLTNGDQLAEEGQLAELNPIKCLTIWQMHIVSYLSLLKEFMLRPVWRQNTKGFVDAQFDLCCFLIINIGDHLHGYKKNCLPCIFTIIWLSVRHVHARFMRCTRIITNTVCLLCAMLCLPTRWHPRFSTGFLVCSTTVWYRIRETLWICQSHPVFTAHFCSNVLLLYIVFHVSTLQLLCYYYYYYTPQTFQRYFLMLLFAVVTSYFTCFHTQLITSYKMWCIVADSRIFTQSAA